MKRFVWLFFLVGCNASQAPPTPTMTPSSSVSAISTAPTPTPTPSPSSAGSSDKANLDEIIRLAGQSSYLGMTNRARAEMLLSHLIAAGKQRLLVTWEIYPEGIGLFDVTYTIEPLSRLTSPSPTPTAAPARKSPFDRPPRRKTSGVRLTWTYDTRKGTCVPKDARTKALLELKPILDEQGLESVLPATWRTTPLTEPPTLMPDETPPPPPPAEGGTTGELPIRVTGFLGGDKDRRVVLTQNEQTLTLGPGDRLGPVQVKSMDEDEVGLEFQGQDVRLAPGALWTPGKL